MVRVKNKELLSEIRKYKLEMAEETIYVMFYTLKTYLSSLVRFGSDSMVTEDVKNIFSEFANINKFELRILNFIKTQICHIDDSIAFEIIDEMNENKENDIEYYYQVLDDIDEAIELNRPFRAKRAKKEHKSSFENDDILNDTYASSFEFDQLLTSLKFSSSFQEYIKDKIMFYDIFDDPEDESFSGVYYKFNEDESVSMKIVLPYIVNYKTILMNIGILSKAYYLFLMKARTDFEEIHLFAKNMEGFFLEDFNKQKLQLLK